MFGIARETPRARLTREGSPYLLYPRHAERTITRKRTRTIFGVPTSAEAKGNSLRMLADIALMD